MSLADGDLQRKIEQSAPSIRQAVDWVCQAACGIDHAHRLGIIHCDLKPSNLLLSPGNTVVISDFGLAGSEFELSARGHFAGTPGFMAPEQIAQGWGDISIRTDVYGLGATLFALLARRPPYIGSRASDVISQVLAASPPIRLAALRPRIPKGLDDICQQCLAKDPSQRFKDVQDLQNTLDRFRD